MPKTRRKQRKRKSRKKRGGDVNPFMFKSTHNANMEKMQIQIDDRDDQIQKLLSETVKLINSKETEKALKQNEHSINMKAKLLKGVNAVKQQLKDEKAEDFKNALIGDLKEKEGELKASEEKFQNCDQIKEGLEDAIDDLQEQYKRLGEQSVEDLEEINNLKRRLKMRKKIIERYKTNQLLRSNVLDNISRAKKCKAYSKVQNDSDVDYHVRREARTDCQKNGCKICDSECVHEEDDCDTDEEEDDDDNEKEGGGRRKRRRKSRKRKSKKKKRRRKRKRTKKRRRRRR